MNIEPQNIGGFIFRCSNGTIEECFQLDLFGESTGYGWMVKQVKRGNALFLYNCSTQMLFGKYVAMSDGQNNIESRAWGGGYPQEILTKAQVIELEKVFAKAEFLPPEEIDFRKKFFRRFWADDGHNVRSMGELLVDNWLFHKEIVHGYERKIPIVEDVYCDFIVPLEDTKGYVYIEYWGMGEEKYQKRRLRKIYPS